MTPSPIGLLVLAALCGAATAQEVVRPEGEEPYVLYGDVQVPLDRHYRGLGSAGLMVGVDARQLWRNGKVNYYVAEGALKSKVAWAARHIEDNTCIEMTECSTESGCAKPYIKFQSGSGCSSPIGVTWSRVNRVNVGRGCHRGIVVHEILHSLGVPHEQTRNDRDEYVTVNFDNIKSGVEYNFRETGSRGRDLGPYDYTSIMHYGATAFAKSWRQKTIEAPRRIGQRNALSAGDIATVDFMYNSCSQSFTQPRCMASKDEGRALQVKRGETFEVEFNGLYSASMTLSYDDSTASRRRMSFSRRQGSSVYKAGKTVVKFRPSDADSGRTLVIAARFSGAGGVSCTSKVTVRVDGPLISTPAPLPTPAPPVTVAPPTPVPTTAVPLPPGACVDDEAWCESRSGWCKDYQSVRNTCKKTCGLCSGTTEVPVPTTATPLPTTPSPATSVPTTPSPAEVPVPTPAPEPATPSPSSCKDYSEAYCKGNEHLCRIGGFANDCPVTCGTCA
eukprot:TRINITY_DN4230_c1_g2_i3.p1 TRINITY_DN4230_c1_g2~~TRINITY_DN4230_c1_g2_i3.p1  ORF type:complete len:503 (+),score=144.52 TRINITY_DN4230_c1_g2_i3:59-1567(+)